MTIHLPEDLARFIHDAVGTGRYSREDEVIRDAVARLKQSIEAEGNDPVDCPRESSRHVKSLTKQEFQRHLVEIGVLDQPDAQEPAAQAKDEIVEGEDEILSDRVIRERLIEWLAGFI